MYRSRRSHRRPASASVRPLVAFLLIASFGILFAGCKGPEAEPGDEFVFTAEDVERFRRLAREEEDATTGSGTVGLAERPFLEPIAGTGAEADIPVLDLSMVGAYQAIRAGRSEAGSSHYRVTNEFLNLRAAPSVTAENIARLDRGDTVDVLEFVNAGWAKVKTVPEGREGYVAVRYIGKLTSEEKLAEEKKKFEGMYFVDFGFVNVRKAPDAQSEKLGELPGQAIVKPISMDNVWARITFQGKEGYVAVQYLSPFTPNFLVRQEEFTLPILQYRATQDGVQESLTAHIRRLKEDGMRFITLREFRDLLLRQEERDVRLDPKTVVIAVTGVSEQNVKAVSDALVGAGARATLFVETQHVGLSGITEKTALTLVANGFDLQSATHSGDDLRSLTNAQVELELKQSRQLLEALTGQPVFAVAYPQGGVNDRVMQLAEAAGYLVGVSDAPERTFSRGQLLRMPSILVTPVMTADEVSRIAKGG